MNEIAILPPAVTRTYGALSLRGKDWVLSDIEPHVAIRLKQIFPRIPKTSVSPFVLARGLMMDSDLLWFTQRYPLRMTNQAAAELSGGHADYVKLQAQMEAILLPSYLPSKLPGLRPGKALRHYQEQAVELCYHSTGLLLGDDCGLGKTFCGIGLCLRPGTLPAAIVCQGHIQGQWKEQFETNTFLRVHEVRTRSVYSLPPADIYVFRYSQISGWTDIFAKGFFRAAVFDEPQELRTGSSSQKGRASMHLAMNAGWVLGLTATPIYNYGTEIWNVMRFFNQEALGDFDDFQREWVAADTKRLKDPKALGTYLREQHVFLRRTKADVGKELAAVNRVIDYVEYDEGAVESIEKLARQLALRAVSGSFVERGSAARELDLRVRQATGVAKARSVAAVVKMLVASGQPVLLVGWHHEVYDIWLREFGALKPAMYTGRESLVAKKAAKERFLTGETDLMIMSLRGGAGLDGLQARCSTIVFGELDWSPGIHHQLIERVDREGQESPVMALFLVADDGSDPPMMEVLGIKASDARQVIDPMISAAQVHSDGSRLKALLRRYLDDDDFARAVNDGLPPEGPPPEGPPPASGLDSHPGELARIPLPAA